MLTNTNSQGLKEAVYTFEIVSIPAIIDAKGFQKTEFEFKPVGIESKTIKASFFDNQLGEVLLALDCRQVEEGVFDWEPAEVYGKQVRARLIYEADKKGKIDDKTGKVVTYRRLVDFQKIETINPDGVVSPEMIPWES